MVEQLCYTRSAVDTSGPTEFTLRAASGGVIGVRGVRSAAFGRYLRYTLPDGTDSLSANTENSPVCLAYVDVGSERIAVHKVYTGRDPLERSDIYLIHLLAGLPETFSVRDAIDMWKSSFWLVSESQRPLDPKSMKLPLVSPPLLKDLLKNLDRATLDALDRESERWPEETRKEWQHYYLDLRPTMGERVGNALKAIIPNSAHNILLGKKVRVRASSSAKISASSNSAVSSPRKQPTPSNVPGNRILQPVSPEWVNKVAEVKKLYIEYRYQKISNEIIRKNNMNRIFSEKKQLQYLAKEQEKLREPSYILDNETEWVEKVREDLWIDQLIAIFMQDSGEKWVQWLDTMLRQEHAKVYKEFRRYHKKVYRKLSRGKGIPDKGIIDEEVQNILFIFERYYLLAQDLYCREEPRVLDDQLRPLKEEFPFHSM